MIDKQIEQLVLLGIKVEDRGVLLQYLSGKDYNAAKLIVDKAINEAPNDAVNLLQEYVDSKIEIYKHMFEEVPFDDISDHKYITESEEFN